MRDSGVRDERDRIPNADERDKPMLGSARQRATLLHWSVVEEMGAGARDSQVYQLYHNLEKPYPANRR